MARRNEGSRRSARSIAIIVASVVSFVVTLTAPAAAAEEVGTGSGLITCRFADSTDGVVVSWATVDSPAEQVVVERALVDPERVDPERVDPERIDTEPWEVRGDVDAASGEFTDTDITGLVPDAEVEAPLDRATSTLRYRVVLIGDDEVLATAPCAWGRGNSGRFECSVDVTDGSYLVEWTGGPTGAGLDYIVERDVNDEDVFHWRGRRFDRQFVDDGSRRLPTYRVTARFDREAAVSTLCTLDGIVATLAADASFVCPAPGATFVDTFGADRDGGARSHKGVDMFASVGSPVVAPESGDLVLFWNELGGKSFGVYGDSGTFYYGAHLDSFVGVDRRVVAGELIGTVGNTGNARTTPPHLHFQVHPGGRRTAAANPTLATAAACRPA